MKKHLFLAALAVSALSTAANAVPVTLTALTGTTGGVPANTTVFKADLSGLGAFSIAALQISDSGSGIGGAPSEFSGYDLDGIKLSYTDCATAACAAAAAGVNVFDFNVGGTFFSAGAMRPPAAPKLFGTNAAGTNVDDSVARLGLFDGNATTGDPDGFLSLGDGGVIAFNLTSALAASGLFLYIGEVGGNGETASGDIQVFSSAVPEPAALGLLGLGLLGIGARRLRR